MENKNRMINTRLWVDGYVSELDPSEKLAWLYILTNPYTKVCGIYELPLKYMAVETGIDKDMVVKILSRFENDGKIKYANSWISIKNFVKYQNLSGNRIQTAVDEGFSVSPKDLVIWVKNPKTDIPIYPIDTLSPTLYPKGKEVKGKERKVIVNDRAVDPRIKVLIDYFYDKHLELKGRKIHIDGGKDGSIIKSLLKTFSETELKSKIDLFLTEGDEWTAQAGYSIGVFKSQVNKLNIKPVAVATGKDAIFNSTESTIYGIKYERPDFVAYLQAYKSGGETELKKQIEKAGKNGK